VIYITTYETVKKNPFGRVERELNSKLLSLKKEGKLDDRTYNRLHLTDDYINKKEIVSIIEKYNIL
jgi:ribosomal protein L19E